MVAEEGVGVEVKTQNAMNVVNLDTLLGSADCALDHVALEVEGGEVQVLIGVVEVRVMVMIAVVIALVGEDLQDDVAFHLPGVATTAGPLHIVLAVIHLMPMQIKIRM